MSSKPFEIPADCLTIMVCERWKDEKLVFICPRCDEWREVKDKNEGQESEHSEDNEAARG